MEADRFEQYYRYLFDISCIDRDKLFMSIPLYAIRFLKSLPDDVVGKCALLIRQDMSEYFKREFPEFVLLEISNESFLNKIPKIRGYYWRYVYRKILHNINYGVLMTFDEYRKECLFTKAGCGRVSVIHDLKGLKKDDTDHDWCYNFYDKLIRLSDRIIAISAYTKNDIIKYYGTSDDKVKVVYNGIQVCSKSIKPDDFPDNIRFVLYVNTLRDEKNPITLIKAYKEIRKNHQLKLVLVGKDTDGWKQTLLPYAKEHGFAEDIIKLQSISDANLRYLYEHAELFVTTSLHEGFGYTPIEAAIYGCPVISSTCEALPDTTRMMLNYYEPATDENALINKVEQLLASMPSEKQLEELSSFFRYHYSPQKQVQSILDILEEVMSKKENSGC